MAPHSGSSRHVDQTLALSFAGCDGAIDRPVPLLAVVVFCVIRHCVPVSAPWYRPPVSNGVHVVASILGSWLSEATAADADLCVPYVAQSSQTGRVSAAIRLKAAPSSSQKDAKSARKVLKDPERSVTVDAQTRSSDCKGQASPTTVQALEQLMV